MFCQNMFSNSVVFLTDLRLMAFICFYLVPAEVSKDVCFAGEGTDLQRPSVASDPMDPGASRSRDAPKSRWARRGRTDVTDVTDDRNDRMEDVEDQREVPASQSPGASESLERMAEMDGPQESAQD